MDLLLVGIGGIFGGLSRYQLGKLVSAKVNTSFPVATFIINLTGAFLLGIVTNLYSGQMIYLFLGDGFLGTYTTFSTFMYENVSLIKGHESLNAVVYIISSLILGIAGFLIGYIICGFLLPR